MTQITAPFPTNTLSTGRASARRGTTLSEETVEAILGALERIRFGSVAITLHEGRVVQLDITEKKRLTPA